MTWGAISVILTSMKRLIEAQRVISARTSDTGDGIRLVLLDDLGEEMVVTLPLEELAGLKSWLDDAGRKAGLDGGGGPPEPVQVDRWSIRPEPDEEYLVLGFRLVNQMELALRLHRGAAAQYGKALQSLLGRMLPAAVSKAKH